MGQEAARDNRLGQAAATAKEITLCNLWTDEPYYDVSFAIHKSRRYHGKMREFYRGCHSIVVASTALTGTSAFVAILSSAPPIVAQLLTGIIAVTTTFDLVFGFSRRADTHDSLCKRFTELSARLIEWDETEKNYRKACAERLRIEKDEPAEKRLVDLQSRNEEARARGVGPEALVPLSALQRRFGYVVTFGLPRVEKWHADRASADSAGEKQVRPSAKPSFWPLSWANRHTTV
jgi:hypothetical protein